MKQFSPPIHRAESPPASFQKLVGPLTDSLESNYSKVGGRKEAPESSLSFSGARFISAVTSANCASCDTQNVAAFKEVVTRVELASRLVGSVVCN